MTAEYVLNHVVFTEHSWTKIQGAVDRPETTNEIMKLVLQPMHNTALDLGPTLAPSQLHIDIPTPNLMETTVDVHPRNYRGMRTTTGLTKTKCCVEWPVRSTEHGVRSSPFACVFLLLFLLLALARPSPSILPTQRVGRGVRA